MIPQSKGKMYVAAERGFTETDWFRSYNTFQFGAYQHLDKQPFHSLYVLNNDTLAGGKSFSLLVEKDSDIIVIPTVGAVQFSDSQNNKSTIEVGQVLRFTVVHGTTIVFENPYADDPINFLQLWLKKEIDSATQPLLTSSFNLEENRNKLEELFLKVSTDASRFFMGKFGGRQEIEYTIGCPGRGLFLYILEGAFEVAYRLLETGDALALWDIESAEIEALSNDAIILLIEMNLIP